MPAHTQKAPLLIGTAEIDITPPVGTPLAGSLQPRPSIGIEDPLYVKAIVLESGGRKLAYAVFDLIALNRKEGDRGVALSSERTGIPQENIVWAATHTHTGPYTSHLFDDEPAVDEKYLATIPDRMAECIVRADRAKIPAGLCHLRSFHYGMIHNRRVTLKNGKAINTWNLGQTPEDIQAIGTSGPTDPEIGILSFDGEKGELLVCCFQQIFTFEKEAQHTEGE